MRSRCGGHPAQLIGAPEVNQVLPELPILADLIKNLYDSHYDKFFVALGVSLRLSVSLPLSARPS